MEDKRARRKSIDALVRPRGASRSTDSVSVEGDDEERKAADAPADAGAISGYLGAASGAGGSSAGGGPPTSNLGTVTFVAFGAVALVAFSSLGYSLRNLL